MTRKALLVGIDHYPAAPLAGCVNDAESVAALLERHDDNSPNFAQRVFVSSDSSITRDALREQLQELFKGDSDVALFFFAGHGTFDNLTGGYLVTQDATRYDQGVAMSELLALANKSQAREAVIFLDCCFSGSLGAVPGVAQNEIAVLRQGVSILSACRESEMAAENGGRGLFSSLLCGALDGGAADVCGKTTVASVYAYVDQALGAWEQRPLFKSHVTKLVSLRNCGPAVDLAILRLLPSYFEGPFKEYALDPSYEPDAQPKHAEHEKIFGHLQRLRAGRLVEPVGEDHMYYAAMNSKACRLTPLGRYYWHLANSGKI